MRENVYLQGRGEERISIADFYKNDSRLCQERGAAVQNLASFCGRKSYLVLYDATNPITLESDKYALAYSVTSRENLSNIESIIFDFEGISKIYRTTIHSKRPLNRNYIICNFYLKQEDSKSIQK